MATTSRAHALTSRARIRAALTMTFAATALLATGCTGDVHPGSAVSVGDDTISLSTVDKLTEDYCEANLPQFKAQNQAYPMNLLRWDVVNAVIDREVGDQLAAKYDVRAGNTYGRQVNSLRGSSSGLSDSVKDSLIEIAGARAYVTDISTQAAKKLAGSGASEEAVAATAVDLRKQWTTEHPVRIDPRFGLTYQDGRIVPNGDDNSLSVPVGAAAQDGQLLQSVVNAQDDQQAQAAMQKLIDRARQLPADQRCG